MKENEVLLHTYLVESLSRTSDEATIIFPVNIILRLSTLLHSLGATLIPSIKKN
jgi:hypothetical protein